MSSREFRLSPFGSRRGVSCDERGAFVSGVPLLTRTKKGNGFGEWKLRDHQELSADLSKKLGLPIDVSSKSKGIAALAKAFDNGEMARAQLIALHLEFPESQPLPTVSGHSRERFVEFVRALHSSKLLKIDWLSDEHPRWPAGAPDSQGGQFAPKGEGEDSDTGIVENDRSDHGTPSSSIAPTAADRVDVDSTQKPLPIEPIPAVAHDDDESDLLEEIGYVRPRSRYEARIPRF